MRNEFDREVRAGPVLGPSRPRRFTSVPACVCFVLLAQCGRIRYSVQDAARPDARVVDGSGLVLEAGEDSTAEVALDGDLVADEFRADRAAVDAESSERVDDAALDAIATLDTFQPDVRADVSVFDGGGAPDVLASGDVGVALGLTSHPLRFPLSGNTLTLSGTCNGATAAAVRILATTAPLDVTRLVDAAPKDLDCSDGTWSIYLDGVNPALEGIEIEVVHGSEAILVEIVAPGAIVTPTRSSRFYTRQSTLDVASHCPAGYDWSSDGRLFDPCGAIDRTVSVGYTFGAVSSLTARSFFRAPTGEVYEDNLALERDLTSPVVTEVGVRTTSGANNNFPTLQLRCSEGGTLWVTKDPRCEQVIAAFACAAGELAVSEVFVPDNSTTDFSVVLRDYAGNQSACTALGTYTEQTLGVRPCDGVVMGGAMSWATFKSRVDAIAASPNAYDDAELVVCINDTVRVTSGPGAPLTQGNVTLRGVGAGRPEILQPFLPPHGAYERITINSGVNAPARWFRDCVLNNVRALTLGELADSTVLGPLAVAGFVGTIARTSVSGGLILEHLGGVGAIERSSFESHSGIAFIDFFGGDAFLGPIRDSRFSTMDSAVVFERNAWWPDPYGAHEGVADPIVWSQHSVGGVWASTGNSVCTGGTLLAARHTSSAATTPYAPISTYPALTSVIGSTEFTNFPWGDASDVANAPHNLQTLWLDNCP